MNTVSKTLFCTLLITMTLGLKTKADTPPKSDKPSEISSNRQKLSGETSDKSTDATSDFGSEIQTPATFNGGGMETFQTWFARNLMYPQFASENGIQGNVTATFVIKSDGSLTDIKIISSPDESLSTEVIRVLKSSPKWTPAINTKGESSEMLFNFPVIFRTQ